MPLRITLTLLLATWSMLALPQHITLQGDRFLDEQGQPFFPMIMSYCVDYFYTSQFVPDPAAAAAQVQALSFGRSSAIGSAGTFSYPEDQGMASILTDLKELKAQGFNTLRLLSNVRPLAGAGTGLEVKRHPTGQDHILLHLLPPYVPDLAVNPVCWFHFNAMLHLCSLANSVDMKVLLEPFMNSEMILVEPESPELQDHVAFLEAIAAFIHDNNVTNLLAYEFYGEPTYAYPSNGAGPDHTKADICAIARAWNQAVKSQDPDHLTTIGGVFFDDVLRRGWDPLLLEVDFASPHLYPMTNIHEWEADPGTYLDHALQRYQWLLAWYDRYLTKPYVISETAFSGADPTSASGAPNPFIAFPYAVDGNEAQQDHFLRNTLPMIEASRCAGYGWWLMQNSHWYPDPPPSGPPFPHAFPEYRERYFGLLRDGDPTPAPGTTGYEPYRKLAAQTLVDHATTPLPPMELPTIPSTLDMGHRYYNPYMHPVNTGITWYDQNGHPYYGTLTGQVLDQFGSPIAGAVVKGDGYIGRMPDENGILQPVHYGHFTYTDQDGYFELRGHDPLPENSAIDEFEDPLGLSDRTIKSLTIGAHGSAWALRGWDHIDEVFHPFQATAIYVLNSMCHLNDLELDGVVIWANESETYKALNTITAHDVVVTGGADMYARYSVNWKPGFHAVAGSEVHAYVQPVFIECEDIAATDLKIAAGVGVPVVERSQAIRKAEREVDLAFHFTSAGAHVRVFPNPGRLFQIEAGGMVHGPEAICAFHVTDERGAVVREGVFMGPQHLLDLGGVASGRYIIHLSLGKSRSTHPVIVH
jgi:hypothetical protein